MNPCKAFWISGLSRGRTLIGGCARVVRLIGGCALWSKTVVLGVVRGLCADFPQGSPFKTEQNPYWCSLFRITPYSSIQVLLPFRITPYHFLFPLTSFYSVLERSTGLCAGLCAQASAAQPAQGLCSTSICPIWPQEKTWRRNITLKAYQAN